MFELLPEAEGLPEVPSLSGPEPPTGAVAFVAAYTCPMTERLGRECGFPVAVVAATADPIRHAARLAETWYAGFWPQRYADWPLTFDNGLLLPRDVAYVQAPFDGRWLGSARLPRDVALASGALRVSLPAGASAADLGAVLRSGLVELSFDRVARRPDRVRYRYATQRPVVVAPRYALITPGDVERVVVAEDLMAFGPGDFAMVASAVALSLESLALTAAIGRIQDATRTGEARRG